ncbi:hypothetical protein DdX_08116 [Ditylenchus destructor]|uniref:Uncharacterized protein n=1 Tax=Ditylenchus destructor TaxID=166010 RepID=A0AAD4R459_9BILA|nr:hypothetical protein DdX_08116 [Ditylenchus destructor]
MPREFPCDDDETAVELDMAMNKLGDAKENFQKMKVALRKLENHTGPVGEAKICLGQKINKDYPAASPHGGALGHPGFPEAINPGTRKCCLRDRYQSTQLAETKRLTYHTPGSEPRRVICDLAKSRIFRISGSHKSRYSQMLPARPVPIDSARRDEAIDVSHARIRAPTRDL